jgi:hypothetical protein
VSERATADPEGEGQLASPPEDVSGGPRSRARAGLDEQGSFVGSNTRQQDPAFGGTGKPDTGDRDFSRAVDRAFGRLDDDGYTDTPDQTTAAADQDGAASRREAAERRSVDEEAMSPRRASQLAAVTGVGEGLGAARRFARVTQSGGLFSGRELVNPSAAVGPDFPGGESATGAGFVENVASRLSAGTGVRDALRAGTAASGDLRSRAAGALALDLAARQDTRQEVRQDVRQEARQEVRQEARQEVRQEPRIEFRQEFRFDFDPTARIPDRDGDGDDGGRRPGGEPRESDDSAGAGDSLLNPSWLRENAATAATLGTGTFPTPSTERLEEFGFTARATGNLPTGAELYGDEQTQEALEDTFDLFSFGSAEPFNNQ